MFVGDRTTASPLLAGAVAVVVWCRSKQSLHVADAVEAATVSPRALAKQLQLGNTATLERRIRKELEDIGLSCQNTNAAFRFQAQFSIWSTIFVHWLHGTMVERRSLAGELSLSCARPAVNEWPLLWLNHLLLVSQPGQFSLSSFWVDKWVVNQNRMCATVCHHLVKAYVVNRRPGRK